MIKQTAIVTRAEQGMAYVKVVRESTCGQCNIQKGCGTNVFSKVLGNKFTEIKALNPINAETDDVVILGMRESVLINSALIMYLFPLLMMFISAVAVIALNDWLNLELGQVWVIMASFAGLITALLIIKKLSDKHAGDKRFQPVILGKATLSEMKAFQIPVN